MSKFSIKSFWMFYKPIDFNKPKSYNIINNTINSINKSPPKLRKKASWAFLISQEQSISLSSWKYRYAKNDRHKLQSHKCKFIRKPYLDYSWPKKN